MQWCNVAVTFRDLGLLLYSNYYFENDNALNYSVTKKVIQLQ